MRKLIAALLIASSVAGSSFAQTANVKADDLGRLTGAQWKGTLTYLDYGRNEKVSIPSNLTVSHSGADERSWMFEYRYPDEPKADGGKSVTVGKDGLTINDERVIERTTLADGTLKIVTEKAGKDNDKPSLFRFTYLLGPKSFSIRKEVRHEGAAEFFERNQYSWTR